MKSSYYYIGIVVLLVAVVVIVVVSQNEPAPQQAEAPSGMPPGHPDVGQEGMQGEGGPNSQNVRMAFLDTLKSIRQRVEARGGNDTSEVLTLARMLFDSHQIEESIPYFERYAGKAPKNMDAKIDLSVAYFELQRYDEAKKATEAVLKSDPDNTIAMYNLGVIYHIKEDTKKAKEIWNDLISKYPHSPDAERAKQLMMSL